PPPSPLSTLFPYTTLFRSVGFGLPAEGTIEGSADEYLRDRAKQGIERFSRQALNENHWEDFARSLFFVPGSFNDAHAYGQLKAKDRKSTRLNSSHLVISYA